MYSVCGGPQGFKRTLAHGVCAVCGGPQGFRMAGQGHFLVAVEEKRLKQVLGIQITKKQGFPEAGWIRGMKEEKPHGSW